MAHENLRFNLILRRSTTATFGTSSSLNPIYSDQAYGTHYGLFGDFKTNPSSEENYTTIIGPDGEEVEKPCFDVKKIAIILQNYTGSVSIGVTKILGVHIKEAPEEFKVNNFSTGRLIQLYVSLQALSNKYDADIDLEANGKSLVLIEGDMLEVIVAYNAVKNEYSGIDDPERNKNALFVDEKYMWRDGEEVLVDQDLVEYRRTLGHLHTAGFFLSNELNPSEDSNDAVAGDANTESPQGHNIVSRPGDPRCKMKVSDIYIIS